MSRKFKFLCLLASVALLLSCPAWANATDAACKALIEEARKPYLAIQSEAYKIAKNITDENHEALSELYGDLRKNGRQHVADYIAAAKQIAGSRANENEKSVQFEAARLTLMEQIGTKLWYAKSNYVSTKCQLFAKPIPRDSLTFFSDDSGAMCSTDHVGTETLKSPDTWSSASKLSRMQFSFEGGTLVVTACQTRPNKKKGRRSHSII